jgi:uncharacterized protein DUF2336
MLVGRSWADELLAETVGARRDLPRRHFEKLVAAASAAVRDRLAQASPHLADDIRDIVSGISEETRAAPHQPRDYAAAKNTIKMSFAANKLGEKEVAGFAQQGKFEYTAFAIATICDVPLEAVERAFQGEGGEPVLILAKAAGFSWPTAQCLLRLSTDGATMSAQECATAHAHFDTLKITTAQRFYKVRQANVKGR